MHVYDRYDTPHGKIWVVDVVTTGGHVTKIELFDDVVKEKNMVTNRTTYEASFISCKVCYGSKKPFRYVRWKGFSGMTREPISISNRGYIRGLKKNNHNTNARC
jgi:hypothetical protein